ncbi:MAG: hypothetical protein ACRCWJ_02545 [Casimicrobium sp.]
MKKIVTALFVVGFASAAWVTHAQSGNNSAIVEVPVSITNALGTQFKVSCDVTNKGGFLLAAPVAVGAGVTTRPLDAQGSFNGVVQVAVRYSQGDSYVCHLLVQDHRGRWQDARQAAPGADVPHAARNGSNHRAEHWDWATFR